MLIFAKLASSYLIGKFFGLKAARGEFSPVLGLALTVAFAMAACVVLDRLAGSL
jgi:hypothetical protein